MTNSKHIESNTLLKDFPNIYNAHIDEFNAHVDEFEKKINDAISELQSSDINIINKFGLLKSELENAIDMKIDEGLREYEGEISGGGISLDNVMYKVDAVYLKKSDAEDTYLSKLAASNIYATKSLLSNYARKEDIPNLEGFLSISDVEGVYAKKSDLVGFASKDLLSSFAKKSDVPDVSGFLKDTEIQNYVDYKLSDYVKNSDIEEYARKDDVPVLTGYLTVNMADSMYVKKSELDNLVKKGDILNFAEKSDIPDISNLATRAEIMRLVSTDTLSTLLNGYVQTGTMKNYALTVDVENMLNDYADKSEIELLKYKISMIEEHLKKLYLKDDSDDGEYITDSDSDFD